MRWKRLLWKVLLPIIAALFVVFGLALVLNWRRLDAQTQAQLIQEGSDLSSVVSAALHNSSSSRQRAHLLQMLQDYEGDARSLTGQSPQAATNPAPSAAL